jgi:hypothetical protein
MHVARTTGCTAGCSCAAGGEASWAALAGQLVAASIVGASNTLGCTDRRTSIIAIPSLGDCSSSSSSSRSRSREAAVMSYDCGPRSWLAALTFCSCAHTSAYVHLCSAERLQPQLLALQ